MAKILLVGLWKMPHFESDLPHLICHESDADLLLSLLPQLNLLFTSKGLAVFDAAITAEDVKLLDSISNLRLSRYLDRYYIWAPEDDLAYRQRIFDAFFESIADSYDSLIDVHRNLENIRNLIRILRESMDRFVGSTIVDYGCGTGLSHRLTADLGISVIGVDRCPKMRQIAAQRGMLVCNIGELAQRPQDSIDGAFSSYVFHLLPHAHGLQLLWSRLRPNGVLAVNFHKNQGIELVESCIQQMNGTIVKLNRHANSEKHGRYAAYRKS
jgi:SAM-dependent methyltransferase